MLVYVDTSIFNADSNSGIHFSFKSSFDGISKQSSIVNENLLFKKSVVINFQIISEFNKKYPK